MGKEDNAPYRVTGGHFPHAVVYFLQRKLRQLGRILVLDGGIQGLRAQAEQLSHLFFQRHLLQLLLYTGFVLPAGQKESASHSQRSHQ